LRDTRSAIGGTLATALFVGAWGWFLYQGVVDPLGGINSLWPIFGIANQLLAVLALALGTTVLIKMGRARYAWVTLLPLGWLLCVTVTAGLMKIFSPAPLGFLPIARGLEVKIAAGGTAEELKAWSAQLFNNRVDAAVTAVFLVLVAIVLVANARTWWQLLSGRRTAKLSEDPYVAVAATESV
jgi:carbon starvation protein